MTCLNIVAKITGCYVYDQQTTSAFDPLTSQIEMNDGIITYKQKASKENNQKLKKSWWKFLVKQ